MADMVVGKNSSFIFLLIFVSLQIVFAIPTSFNVGVGIADITGPAAEVDMVRLFVNLNNKIVLFEKNV